jgi:oligopeptidase B
MSAHEPPTPPVAPRHPHRLTNHGHVRVDDWYWLRDRENPEVFEYLEAENAYTEAVLAPTKALQDELFEGIRTKVAETDAGAPVAHGGWWYFNRTEEGRQYPIACRLRDPARALTATDVGETVRHGRAAAEEVVLDENVLASGEYLAVGVFDVSQDHNLLAYAVDHEGSELFSLRFKDLRTGESLPDEVAGVYYGSAWAADNETFFYIRPDQAMRPFQVWRHVIGSGVDDVLVFQEDDERFFVGVGLSRDETRIVIHTASSVTSESLWIDAARPATDPKIVLRRETGIEYDVEYDDGSWLVRTNRPGADGSARTNFALYRLPEASDDPEDLEVVIGHREDVTVESVDAFSDYVAVWERHRSDGLSHIRVVDKSSGDEHLVDHPEPAYKLGGEPNPEWEAGTYRFSYTSLVTPATSVEYDVSSRRRTDVWRQLVPSGHDPAAYRTDRLWAPASDGRMIPVSIVGRADVPLDGSAPCVLYGYGAYEITTDPAFSVARLNLIERGVNFAIAHIRGGGELGRAWYEEGRMEHKVNSFTDFVAAAEHVIATGWASRQRLAIRGGSAGGLLMGAVTNMRPDLWRAVVAEVPFVDVMTTMCDPTLPLTVTEWDEWGDPLHDPAAFDRMLGYSPYDNVAPVAYPAMYVTAGVNDPRVGYWEPAKWVAKLRSVGAGTDRPLLLRTEMGAGHRGVSGRYDAWRDEARVQAFILWQLGLGEERGGASRP